MTQAKKLTVKDALDTMEKNKARFVDLRFTDLRGQEQHMTITAHSVNETLFTEGKMFDGSSIAGWKSINSSDMILMPDPNTAMMDPFFDEPTLILRCDVIEPMTMSNYERDPRSLAQRAIAYMNKSGIADTCYFGPEPEFNIFDEVRYENRIGGSFYKIDSEEAYWNTGADYDGGNLGHRPNIKGGYVPVPPVDSSQDLRSAMCVTLEEMGAVVEVHHHEVATANQNEIGVQFKDLLAKADEWQMFKYVIHNVAHAYGKTATFMPKPLVGDNGNGMHCHQSLSKGGKNLFAGDQYGQLSELALHYIGGIIKHARTLNAFTNASTNSYKRLVPGFEAPVTLAYSARNRSAAIRIPFVNSDQARRIEVRFPDPTMNSYLAFSAMLMAGLDGIRNKIHPGEPMDENLYELPREQLQQLPTVCGSLKHALDALRQDHDFLLEGGVFTEDIIEAYVELKQKEVDRVRLATHPLEFELYYSL